MRLLKWFRELRIWQKLAAIALVLGVPAVVLAAVTLAAVRAEADRTRAELDGLEYVEALNRLVEHYPAHRGMTNGYLRGNAAVRDYFRPKILDRRARVDEAFAAIAAADAAHGAQFGSSARWKQIRTDWVALRDQAFELPPDESFARHTKLIADVLALQAQVNERSTLAFDPSPVGFFLQDTVSNRVPALAEYIGQVRGFSNGLAAKKEVTPAERLRVAGMQGQVRAARQQVDDNVRTLGDKDKAVAAGVAPKLTEASARLDAFLTLLDKEIVGAPGSPNGAVSVPAPEVWDKGTAAIEAYFQLNAEAVPALRAVLEQRAGAAGFRFGAAAALIFLALAGAAGLVFAIARGVIRQTKSIRHTLAHIGMGDFKARAEVTSPDELGELAAGMNAMLDNTLKLIQSQEERDQIQASITKLLEEVSDVADGDLTHEAEVTADVTGAIADSFNYMIGQLRTIIGDVQRATREVGGAAGAIYASTQQLAGGAESQSAQIARTSRAVEEMSASIRNVSENAAESAAVARQALANARQGNDAVQSTVAGMGRIRDQVQETAKRIKRLGESSQEIGQAVQLIDDIADRTSILALNASIEAARAGEAGRGFAVVAEEVERLADRSTDATRKIASLVKTIQSETTEAVSAMEKGIQEVVSGSRVAAEAGSALGEIEAVSRKLADLIQRISEASGRQARASEGVTQSMADISEITRQTSAGTKQAADGVQALAGLADELRASVATFRLPASEPAAAVPAATRNGVRDRNGHSPRELAGRF